MPTHQQFLDAIAIAKGDPMPRLVYADWLEEQGDPMCVEWRKSHVPTRVVTAQFDAGRESDDVLNSDCRIIIAPGGSYTSDFGGQGNGDGTEVGDGAGGGAGDQYNFRSFVSCYDEHYHYFVYGYGDFDQAYYGYSDQSAGDGKRAWAYGSGDGRPGYGDGNGGGGEP